MYTYIVLLRGINVGGRNIKMDKLINSLNNLKITNVKTFLQSGNISIQSNINKTDLKALIQDKLRTDFNYPAKVQVLILKEFKQIVLNYLFPKHDNNLQNYIVFVENGLESQISQDNFTLQENEKIKKSSDVMYWQVQKGSTLSTDFAKLLSKAKYKDSITTRNINTLNKIISS